MIVMRLVDIFFAFPFYVMVIALVFVLGSGETSIYLAIATCRGCPTPRSSAVKSSQPSAGLCHGRAARRVLAPEGAGPPHRSQRLVEAIIYAMSDIVQDIMAIVASATWGWASPAHRGMGSMIADGQQFIPRSGSRRLSPASRSLSRAWGCPGSATGCRTC